MKSVGCVAALALAFSAICFVGFSVKERGDLPERLLVAGAGGLFIVFAASICVGVDLWGESRARRRVRRNLMARPDQGDESFSARFDSTELVKALEVRKRIALYFHVDSRKIAADDTLESLEFGLLKPEASEVIGMSLYPDWWEDFDSVGEVIEDVLERQRAISTSPPRSSSN